VSDKLIAVDTKNLALYTGGIAGFVRPLLSAWVAARTAARFVLIGPQWDSRELTAFSSCEHHIVPWPEGLPRSLRHPFYDNVLFPRAIRRVHPDFVFSPYHDVRLPHGIPSAMMVHDTCLSDMGHLYPWQIRAYYRAMLNVNLGRARHVLTVSESSRACILARFAFPAERVTVVPNTLEPDFLEAPDDPAHIGEIRAHQTAGLRLLYPSGAEYRKNVPRLLKALELLVGRGLEPHLWVTGMRDAGWERALASCSQLLHARLHFLGRLSLADLRTHYLASDSVVYPSFCEGFGRVCLEAMELGVPIACSDLPVLREVAGEYPTYFSPRDVDQMADSIAASAAQGRREPHHEPRFHRAAVAQLFVHTMDRIISAECGHV
jgi:glycosyltransferase involved in cell wall biosynthesis